MNDLPTYSHHESISLFARALEVIPNGIYGTKTPGFVVPGSFPYFVERAKGSHFWDVDGNEFVDFMCGYGSQILGYADEEVDNAVKEQIGRGNLLNQPGRVMVDLAETLVEQVAGMDWGVFAKNGSDATDLAVNLVRVATSKRKVIMSRGAYHGTGNWCSSNDYAVFDDKRDVVTFEYNDTATLEELFASYRGEIAAVILTPFHHRTFDHQQMASPDLFSTVRRLCDQEGAYFILDDIRANFRLSLHGSHQAVDADPDLVCMGKCLTNGYPLAALLGKTDLYRTASRFFITGTYWMATAPMVAAIATLRAMNERKILEHMNAVGVRLREGLEAIGAEFAIPIRVSGPPTIPYMTFEDDSDLYSNQIVCSHMARAGIYVHPHHNWFISHAHSFEDIERTLIAARRAVAHLAEVRSKPDWRRSQIA